MRGETKGARLRCVRIWRENTHWKARRVRPEPANTHEHDDEPWKKLAMHEGIIFSSCYSIMVVQSCATGKLSLFHVGPDVATIILCSIAVRDFLSGHER